MKFSKYVTLTSRIQRVADDIAYNFRLVSNINRNEKIIFLARGYVTLSKCNKRS